MSGHLEGLPHYMAGIAQEVSANLQDHGRRPQFRAIDSRVELKWMLREAHNPSASNRPRTPIDGRSPGWQSRTVNYCMVAVRSLRRLLARQKKATGIERKAAGTLPQGTIPLVDRRYLVYLNAVEADFCSRCEHGKGLLDCSQASVVSTKSQDCPLMWSLEQAQHDDAALCGCGARGDNHPRPAQLWRDVPTEQAKTETAQNVGSHLGP